MKKTILRKATCIFALSSLIFSSCDKQEVESFNSQKDTPISIASAGVAELTTRAIIEGQLIGRMEEPIVMSVWVEGSGEKYNANNVEWVHDGTDWWSNSTVLYEGENKQKICALSPYREDATLEDGVTITADGVTDYLVAALTPVTSNSVSLTMTHALTKLVLKPTFGTELTSQTITSVKVGGMYASGTLNIPDNTWSELSDANSTLEMDNKEVLVIPMSGCTSFPIVITTSDGKMFQTDISLASVDNKLEAGTQYTINLKVGKDKVTVEQVSMGDFDSPFGDGWDNEEDLN